MSDALSIYCVQSKLAVSQIVDFLGQISCLWSSKLFVLQSNCREEEITILRKLLTCLFDSLL